MKKQLLVFLLCGTSTMLASGQDAKVLDSLNALLGESVGSARYLILHRMAVEYVDKDNEKALEIVKRAEAQVANSGDTALIIRSQRLKGQILFRLKRIEEAVSVLEPMTQFKNYPKELIYVVTTLGVSQTYLGRFDEALDHSFETVALAKQFNDSEILAVGLKNLGVTYYKLKDYARALALLLESYAIEKDLNSVQVPSLLNISLCYAHLGNYEEARRYLRESIGLCGSTCPTQTLVHLQYGIGCVLLGEQKLDSAKIVFFKSLHLARTIDDARMQLDNIYLLAELFIRRQQYREAERLLRDGERIIEEGIPFNMEKIKVYSRLAELYLDLRNFENAAEYQSRYIALKDSIYDESLTTKLMKVESDFLTRENREKLANQAEMIALNEKVIRQQNGINLLIGGFAVMLLFFLIFFYRGYRMKKDLNKLLERKIRERTRELESSRDSLLRLLHEKDLLIQRIMQAFSNTRKTIEGLCANGVLERVDAREVGYLERILSALHEFANYCQSLKRNQNVFLSMSMDSP